MPSRTGTSRRTPTTSITVSAITPGGPQALANDCKPLLELPEAKQGYAYIAGKFDKEDGYGPNSVRKFVEETQLLEDRTPDQWQTDAFGQVQTRLKALGLA